MFGVDDAIIASAAASAIGGGLNYFGQNSANAANRDISTKTNAFNAGEAQKARAFSEDMANTSWQRGIRDMKLAGVNPMLSVSKGGASAPTGVSASGNAIPMQNNFSGTPQSISSAMGLATAKAQLDLLHEQAESTRQQGNMYGQQANLNMANMNNAVTQGEILKGNVPGAHLKSQVDSGDYGLALEYAKRLGIDFSSAMSVVNILKGKPLPPNMTTQNINGNTGVVSTSRTSYSH